MDRWYIGLIFGVSCFSALAIADDVDWRPRSGKGESTPVRVAPLVQKSADAEVVPSGRPAKTENGTDPEFRQDFLPGTSSHLPTVSVPSNQAVEFRPATNSVLNPASNQEPGSLPVQNPATLPTVSAPILEEPMKVPDLPKRGAGQRPLPPPNPLAIPKPEPIPKPRETPGVKKPGPQTKSGETPAKPTPQPPLEVLPNGRVPYPPQPSQPLTEALPTPRRDAIPLRHHGGLLPAHGHRDAQRVWGVSGGDEIPANYQIGPKGEVLPAQIPVRHKTAGSRNLTLSRDYHFLDLFGLSLFADDSDTLVLDEGLPTSRSFVQAEYLLWWVPRMEIPPLATTGGNFGFIGEPGTEFLLGPGRFGSSARNGMRIRAGTWLGETDTYGIDGSFFFLGRRNDRFQVDSNQFPLLSRPIFVPNINPATGQPFGENAEQVAFPGRFQGVFAAEASSFLWGADVNVRFAKCRTCNSRSEWFLGYRFLELDESLTMTETIRTIGPINGTGVRNGDPFGTDIFVEDRFGTRNRFNGAQVGWAVGRTVGRWDWDTRVSLALGATSQQANVSGFQLVNRPNQDPQFFEGGLLAAGPNLGRFERTRFSAVPEVTLNLGYMVTPSFRTYIGYNMFYWPNVIRPGDQIDRVVDLTFVPNAPPVDPSNLFRPQVPFREVDLWVQGIQFGVEYRW